jgi:hypothetical protein
VQTFVVLDSCVVEWLRSIERQRTQVLATLALGEFVQAAPVHRTSDRDLYDDMVSRETARAIAGRNNGPMSRLLRAMEPRRPRGILMCATGSGKTRTALTVLAHRLRSAPDQLVVVCGPPDDSQTPAQLIDSTAWSLRPRPSSARERLTRVLRLLRQTAPFVAWLLTRAIADVEDAVFAASASWRMPIQVRSQDVPAGRVMSESRLTRGPTSVRATTLPMSRREPVHT